MAPSFFRSRFLVLALGLLAGPAAAQTVGIAAPANANEGSPSGTTVFTFTLTRTGPAVAFTVDYTLSGEVTAVEDYSSASSGTVSFTAAQTTRTIAISVRRDTKFEDDEDLTIALSNPTGGVGLTSGAESATTVVVNDDNPPTISIADRSNSEGNTTATFTLTLSNQSYLTVNVDAATADDTAVQPGDYTQVTTTTVSFPPGTTSATFGVPLLEDTIYELNETYFVNLTNPQNATIGDNQAVGTITADDPKPLVGITGLGSLTETAAGMSGVCSVDPTNCYNFTVTLNRASFETITVPFATVDGTASSVANAAFTGDPKDFDALSGNVVFNPGDVTKTISVKVHDDAYDEPNEGFSVQLGPMPPNVTNAVNLTRNAVIVDDDVAPTIAIVAPAPLTEADAGTPAANFALSLSAPSARVVSVTANTAPHSGTSTPTTDYTPTSAVITWNPGETSKTFPVPVVGDLTDEIDETFRVVLTGATNGLASPNFAIATILDNDNPPTVSIGDVTAAEGNAGVSIFSFPVTLSAQSGKTITVRAATANDTATAGTLQDYIARGLTTLTFTPGATTQTFDITVNGDVSLEPDETFFVNLSNLTNLAGAGNDVQGVGTIQNDESPALTINDPVGVSEGNTGTTLLQFEVTIPTAIGQNVTFDCTVTGVTATAGGPSPDYQPPVPCNGTITAGNTNTFIDVVVNGDTAVEDFETLTVTLSNPAPIGTTIFDGTATGTINNDDAIPVGALVISEFRFSGPVAGGGALNEFIEIHNRTDEDITIYTTDNSSGFSVARNGDVNVFDIPKGTVIKARGYYLGANSAAGLPHDASWSLGIPENSGLALFPTSNAAVYSFATPLDAVGFTAHEGTKYSEGGAGFGLIATAGTPTEEYSWVRRYPYGSGNAMQDTGFSKNDWILVATNLTVGSGPATAAALGGPSPENLSAETDHLTGVLTPSAPGPASVYTGPTPVKSLEFPRRFTYNSPTGPTLTSLKFKVIGLTTVNNNNGGAEADLRVTASDDFGGTFSALTLQSASTYPQILDVRPNAGLNSTLVYPGSTTEYPAGLSLANTGTVDVNFRVEYTLSGKPAFIWIIPQAK